MEKTTRSVKPVLQVELNRVEACEQLKGELDLIDAEECRSFEQKGLNV